MESPSQLPDSSGFTPLSRSSTATGTRERVAEEGIEGKQGELAGLFLLSEILYDLVGAKCMRFLIDTNILIPLEPAGPGALPEKTPEAVEFSRLVTEVGSQLVIHPDQKEDILRDKDDDRRNARSILLKKYRELENPPRTSRAFEDEIQALQRKSHDWVDLLLLVAVERNVADFLVTEDKDLRKIAKRHDLAERILDLGEAIVLLKDLIGPPVTAPPAVTSVLAYELKEHDPIFDSFRIDYPGFEEWLTKCKLEHRQAWLIEGDGGYAALSIVNRETKNFRSLDGAKLKICTFKTSERYSGRKYGELLLKTIFGYALLKKYDWLCVTVFPKYDSLVAFFEDFGFQIIPERTPLGELVLAKPVAAFGSDSPQDPLLDPLQYHIRFGPTAIRFGEEQAFVIPIQPEFHRLLFPKEIDQLELMPGFFPFGNSIRKAYLSNSPTKSLAKGSTVLFYRSQGERKSYDDRGITSIGVVEDTRVFSNPDDLTKFVLKRTIYSRQEIEDMCQKPVLAISFRYAGSVEPPISFSELIDGRVIAAPPQSIQSVPKESIEWLREQLKLRLHF
jgi:GNAT superfamily N-acetyltransferase